MSEVDTDWSRWLAVPEGVLVEFEEWDTDDHLIRALIGQSPFARTKVTVVKLADGERIEKTPYGTLIHQYRSGPTSWFACGKCPGALPTVNVIRASCPMAGHYTSDWEANRRLAGCA